MARCDYCGTMILFGGVKDNDYRFCNDDCHANGVCLTMADQIPGDFLLEQVTEVHQGTCPRCGGEGPVDVHTSHSIWSAFLLTSWKSNPQVCCRGCGVKSMVGGAVFSSLFGWWGFPWGIFMTPVQVVRNVSGIVSAPNPFEPSPELKRIVQINLAAQAIEASQQSPSDE